METIIQLKKKYDKVYKIKVESIDIYYKPFSAKEMIILTDGGESKYKDEITREAIINKEAYDSLKEWASKEILYSKILEISGFKSEEDALNEKEKMKKLISDNPFLTLIRQIITYLPSININELLNCNINQLLFYIVLCEEIVGSKPNNQSNHIPHHIPTTVNQKKATLSKEQLIDVGMEASSNELMNALHKHGVSPKKFTRNKRDQFQE